MHYSPRRLERAMQRVTWLFAAALLVLGAANLVCGNLVAALACSCVGGWMLADVGGEEED